MRSGSPSAASTEDKGQITLNSEKLKDKTEQFFFLLLIWIHNIFFFV